MDALKASQLKEPVSTVASETPLLVHSLQAENFLRLEDVTIDAGGNHVRISGPNASGKTSIQEALWVGIQGLSERDFPEPIHRGKDSARIRLELGPQHGPVELIVERKITKKSMTLNVSTTDGARLPKPQQFLDTIVSEIALDPLVFLDAPPAEQITMLLSVYGVRPPVEAVQKIAGDGASEDGILPRPDESAMSYLDRLCGEHGLYYLRRRELGRTLEAKRKALDEQRKVVHLLGPPPAEAVSSAQVLKQIQSLEQKAEARRTVQAAAADARREHQDKAAKLKAVEAERDRDAEACTDMQEQIAALEKQIEAIRVKLRARAEAHGKTGERIKLGQKVVAELDGEASAAEEAATQLPDPGPQIVELRSQLATIEQTAVQQQKRTGAAEQLKRFESEVKELQQGHKLADDVIAGVRELRGHLLDGIDLGIDGLEIGDGELMLHGVPFRQASLAQRLAVALAIAMRKQPRLRLLRLDNAEHLDRKSNESVLRKATAAGYQVFETCVKDTDRLEIEIVDKMPRTPGEEG